jgi:hypothetical protein
MKDILMIDNGKLRDVTETAKLYPSPEAAANTPKGLM